MFDKKKYDAVKAVYEAFTAAINDPKSLTALGSAIQDTDGIAQKAADANTALQNAQLAQAAANADAINNSNYKDQLDKQAETQTAAQTQIDADRATLDADITQHASDNNAALQAIAVKVTAQSDFQTQLDQQAAELAAAQTKLASDQSALASAQADLQAKVTAMQSAITATAPVAVPVPVVDAPDALLQIAGPTD